MDLEQRLAPICIDKERSYKDNYGTKTHSIIIVDDSHQVLFVEIDRYIQVKTENNVQFQQGFFEKVYEFQLEKS